jgi:hypothetical protein
VKTGLEVVKARDLEAIPKETDSVAERRRVPNEEAAMETIGALEDQYWDWRLTVGCHQQLKKWTQDDGGSRQKLAAARGR